MHEGKYTGCMHMVIALFTFYTVHEFYTIHYIDFKPIFHLAEVCARSGIFLCLVISLMEPIRKDKQKFRSARKIPPSGKSRLYGANGIGGVIGFFH